MIRKIFVLNFVATNRFTFIILFDIYNNPIAQTGQILLPFYRRMESGAEMSYDLPKVKQLLVNRAR